MSHLINFWRHLLPVLAVAAAIAAVVFVVLALFQGVGGAWSTYKRAWEAWKKFGHKIGNFQARIILSIVYAILVLPFGLAARWFSDPLRIKKKPEQWLDHPDEAYDLEWARKQ
jgi:hypothetical protein